MLHFHPVFHAIGGRGSPHQDFLMGDEIDNDLGTAKEPTATLAEQVALLALRLMALPFLVIALAAWGTIILVMMLVRGLVRGFPRPEPRRVPTTIVAAEASAVATSLSTRVRSFLAFLTAAKPR